MCAAPREDSLLPDPEVVAARRIRSTHFAVIDLTRFFCGPKLCYPVVGGVLVAKDTDHMTAAFSTTLGHYVLAQLATLLPSWRAATSAHHR